MSVSFDKKFIQSQKESLLQLKNSILNAINEKGLSAIQIEKDQTCEDGDQAQAYQDQNLSFELMDRDMKKLHDIDHALAKIEDGTYGFCEDSDVPISKKRLEKMPWAKYSIESAEQIEKEHGIFHYGT
ncbi:MAG: TraR/DksA family transcriptional regulator [Bacteriovoracaceae bacterium]|nr:TraR/DksA family transcriptional regulator [Bacteriovoracaceae bacterium]